jgi:hypothetical protein
MVLIWLTISTKFWNAWLVLPDADCIDWTCDLDLFGRARGLGRQRLHFLRHHREAAAGLAGARRLDGRVERQQVGLLGDRADEDHHFAHLQ